MSQVVRGFESQKEAANFQWLLPALSDEPAMTKSQLVQNRHSMCQ